MAQIRQTNRKTGIVYVYEAEPFWDKERKQSRYLNRKMIGHIDPDTGELVPNRPLKPAPAAPSSARLFYGATNLLDQLANQIGLDKDLTKSMGDDAAKAILSFAQFLICQEPAPASRFNLWARTHAHRLDQELSSQRLSELFASIKQPAIQAFFRARAKRAGNDYWFFDTTSISSYSQLLKKVRWGKNKDGVPLPQINLAVVKDATTGLPLSFKDVPGNIADFTLVKQLLADFDNYETGRVKLCLDRGFYSQTNIDGLMDAHMKFLIGVRTGLNYVKQTLDEHHHDLRSPECYSEDRDVYGLRLAHPWTPAGQETTKRSYLHLYYDPQRAVDEEKTLSKLIIKLHRELDTGQTTPDHKNLYTKFFHKTKTGWAINHDAIEAERHKHGYFALLSNDASLDCWQALDIYRSKDQIEKAFHNIKDRLNLRTTGVHNQETWTGKLFTVFTALILTTELQCRMKTAGLNKQYTLTELLDQIETIEQYRSAGHRPSILNITKTQTEIYTKLDTTPPTTS